MLIEQRVYASLHLQFKQQASGFFFTDHGLGIFFLLIAV